jgi:hypothetical protein
MILKLSFWHLLMAAFAGDNVMQASLLKVLSLNRLSTSRVLTFHHRVAAVDGNMVLYLSALDLGFAAVFALWALDNQIIQNVDKNFSR